MALHLAPIQMPVLDPIVVPVAPAKFNTPATPALIGAYAMLLQDFIDDKIRDFDSYYPAMSTVADELQVARDIVLRKYHKERRELLAAEGRKNIARMPGHVMRKLTEMVIEEKREIADAQAKAINERATNVLETLDWVVKAGIDSAALRSETVHGISALNLEILNDALKAGLQVAVQNVERANSLLKLTALLIEEETVQKRIGDLTIIRLIAEAQIEKVNLDVLLYEIEAQSIFAELEVLAAKLIAAENEVLILNAEIEKSWAEWQLSIAQEALAAMKVITAQYERQKSDARMAAAALEDAKVDVRLDKIEAEEGKVEAQRRVELAELSLDIANKRLDLLRDEMEIARKNAEAAITEIKVRIEEAEARSIEQRSADELAYIAMRQRHGEDTVNRIHDLIGQSTENTNAQISRNDSETAALAANVDLNIAGTQQVSNQHSTNIDVAIAAVQREAQEAATVTTAHIRDTERITAEMTDNISVLIGQKGMESRLTAQLIRDRIADTREAITATNESVEEQLAADKEILELRIAEILAERNQQSITASKWGRDLIVETKQRTMEEEHDILDKKEATEEALTTAFEKYKESMNKIIANKKEAIITAAKNAANAKLKSTHIYK